MTNANMFNNYNMIILNKLKSIYFSCIFKCWGNVAMECKLV